MTTIWERTVTALTGLGLPLASGVYIPQTGQTYPDAYLVTSVISAPPQQAGDNAETLRSYRVQITYWTRAGLNSPPAIKSAMVSAGFYAGPWRELPFSQDTGHYGLAWDFFYLEEQ